MLRTGRANCQRKVASYRIYKLCSTYFISAATVESLFKELTKNDPLYQAWDELHTLTESWGIYRSGSGAYDKSFFNTLFSSPDMMRRQIKGLERGEKGMLIYFS